MCALCRIRAVLERIETVRVVVSLAAHADTPAITVLARHLASISVAHRMVQRRAKAANIATRIGDHTFRTTGITAYFKNGGTPERAAAIANYASTRTIQLYDWRSDEVNLDKIEGRYGPNRFHAAPVRGRPFVLHPMRSSGCAIMYVRKTTVFLTVQVRPFRP